MAQIATAQPPSAGWNRLARLPRPVAALLLALLAGLMLLGTVEGRKTVNPNLASPAIAKAEGMIGDHALYVKILRKIEAGTAYYPAVVEEHRAYHYPLRPFAAVRLPTLATVLSIIGLPAGIVLASLLGLATLFAWRRRLMHEADLPAYSRFAVLLVALNLGQVMSGQWVLIHEVVAGTLIALALALYRPERPWAALAAVAAALTIRETVLPVAMLFGFFALMDRNWRAVGAWIALGIAFAIGLAFHAAAVTAATSPTDLAGGGWLGLGGWNNYISFVYKTSILRFVAPYWFATILIPLALLGWLAWRGRLGTAGLLVQIGYAAAFMLFARTDNDYWGMLIAPTLFVGLIFVPAALAALVRSLTRPGVSVSPAAV